MPCHGRGTGCAGHPHPWGDAAAAGICRARPWCYAMSEIFPILSTTMTSDVSSDSEATPWLDPAQQIVWRRWVALTTEISAALNRSLQERGQVSISDYEVLVVLSETEDRCLRVSELARCIGWERSRLSHHVGRMEKRGLVRRVAAVEDARGAVVHLTEQGLDTIVGIAPLHVRDVRRVFFDGMTDEEFAALDSFTGRLMDRLRPDDEVLAPGAATRRGA